VNTRHAAALVAWYLIVPPLSHRYRMEWKLALYSQWFRYFSEEGRERDRRNVYRKAEEDEIFHLCFTARFDEAACETEEAVHEAICIETDDPRLKGM
jgi:hypothetical protein